MAKAANRGAVKRAVSKSGKGRAGSNPQGVNPSPARKASPAPKRPPEISASQWKKLGKSQRQRYAGFYKKHPGAPLYRARGKGAAEHLTRKQREQERIEAFAARQHRRGGRDAGDIVASIQAAVREHGMAAFNRLAGAVDAGFEAWQGAGAPRKGQWAGYGPISTYDPEADFDWMDYDMEDDDLHYH